jgi:hypothetical protein
MQDHMPSKRLLAVASIDDLVFTPEEFNHLKACAECFGTFAEFLQHSPVKALTRPLTFRDAISEETPRRRLIVVD